LRCVQISKQTRGRHCSWGTAKLSQ
jgi:hypothetical protein